MNADHISPACCGSSSTATPPTVLSGARPWKGWICLAAFGALALSTATPAAGEYTGRYFSGEGDREYLECLDLARRMMEPDPECMSLPMLYQPSWNGFVEGPTWGAWWVQNSYGTTLGGLPFYLEPLSTFLQQAQDLWFNKMGDGRTSYVWNGKDRWVPPDGCLMDCANETWAMHKQGDGRVPIHDWGVEFTAAGALLQAELLLIGRDASDRGRYLPLLERCANFLETRRDPARNLFLAGPAGNLLAPSYAGWKKPDGSYGMAYLTGLSVTYIAFLDRLIEVEKLAARPEKVSLYSERRRTAQEGLSQLTADEGYLIKSLDPDGTRHGVYGAAKHGYFEASPNHDAIAFRVVDDAQARRIYAKMASLPGLRPHGLILPNDPSLDDMYEEPKGLWAFGTWVNGGHWTTCEARMQIAYYRLGAYDDALRSVKQIYAFGRQFRLDNPLVGFGSAPYQPNEPINLTYDAFGAPFGFLRGLFEYLYRADGLTLVPHIPARITALEQRFPVRFGAKRLYLATVGQGEIRAVRLNGQPWPHHTPREVFLPYDSVPSVAAIQILLGSAAPRPFAAAAPSTPFPALPAADLPWPVNAPVSPNDLPLRVGADSNGGSRFQGDVARVCLFDRPLTDAEVRALSKDEPSPLLRDPAVVGVWLAGRGLEGFADPAKALPLKAVGQVARTSSPWGEATRLNGEGYLEAPSQPGLALSRGGTVYALVRPETTSGRIVDKCPVGRDFGYLLDAHPGNSPRFITDSGAVSSSTRLTPGQWAHVAATVDAQGRSVLYVNGQAVASAASKQSGPSAQPLLARVERLRRFHERLVQAGLGSSYEAQHAHLAGAFLAASGRRFELLARQELQPLPPATQRAADRLYLSTTANLCDGLERVLNRYEKSEEPARRRLYELWTASAASQP